MQGVSIASSLAFEAGGRFGRRLKDVGFKPDRACRAADTCVQLADFLYVCLCKGISKYYCT